MRPVLPAGWSKATHRNPAGVGTFEAYEHESGAYAFESAHPDLWLWGSAKRADGSRVRGGAPTLDQALIAALDAPEVSR